MAKKSAAKAVSGQPPRPARRGKKKKPKVFISYRRFESSEISGRLYDKIAAVYGRQRVIKDVYSIPPGVDFCDFIEKVIPTCSSLVAIIGPDWSTGRPDDPRSIKSSADMVRLELACALANGIPVFPILVGGAKLPSARSLPKELRGLLRRNAIQLRGDPDFHLDADRLLAHL
jgi:hypothetical protein